jgi:Yip1 domain
MIKALMLIFDPAGTWERIALNRRRWWVILIIYLVPLWVITGAADGWGLIHWGKPQGAVNQIKHYAPSNALIFEVLQIILMLIVVFIGAKLIKAVAETFHARHTFNEAFTVTAYGLGVWFAVRILDIFPGVISWIYWAVWIAGIFLCIGTLYHGIPRVMQPDPPQAFGMYVASSVLLIFLTGLVRFLTYWYLIGNFAKLDVFISNLVDRVPFLQSLDRMHF